MSPKLSPLEIELLWRRLVTTVDEAATTLVGPGGGFEVNDYGMLVVHVA